MRIILFLFSIAFFASCNSGGGGGASADLAGFETESAGNGVTKAYKVDSNGKMKEQGFVSGGKRNGVWMSYYDGEDAGKVKSLASYSNGALNGPYFELDNRGQIKAEVNYTNNMYDGESTTYKYGRKTSLKTYKKNKLDGLSIEYFQDGKVQKEINFKDGKQHGTMKWYSDKGEVTMQYEYKNGEKISGGMVEK